MTSRHRLVRVEIPRPTALEQSCHTQWELTDRGTSHWRYWCHEHEVDVPLKASECPARRFISDGIHELPLDLAEQLVGRKVASFVEERPVSGADSVLNEALRRSGLPAAEEGTLDFMRKVASAKSTRVERGASPSRIADLSQDDLSAMRGVLKDLRDRK